ncbi:MAG: WYL domain-containing protein [Bacteroidales bacterium]|jgi:hypothetical protein|nr:WYL domain-containing protein [Bacteroidales bacterium]MCI2133524.1 WYL domain-containing protein [Bacteroidales bacterium]
MCKKLSSFEQLGNFLRDMPKVETSLFEVLSDNKASYVAKRKAAEDLDAKVDNILMRVESQDFLFGVNESKSDYNDYCRNLAAHILAFRGGDKKNRIMIALEMLLENMAPTYKTELRALKKKIIDNGEVKQLGFDWQALKLPFFADKFSSLFCNTSVFPKATPQIVYVDREIIKEVVKVVEKEKVVKEYVQVKEDVKPKEDPSFFGKEDQYTEFKSSFIEKPESARYDNQKIEVCRKICGFLNADGGVVYIGVDPESGHAFPVREGRYHYGIARDMFVHLRSYTYCHAPLNNPEIYARWIKREIHNIFQSSNPDTISLFINECIRVEQSKRHENVIEISVKPSLYCLVYLNSIAYQRCGEECVEMDSDMILVRRQNLKRITNEVKFYDKLMEAKRLHKQAILYAYSSANSGTISDRRIEPYEFVCNGESVLCYDMDKKAIRQFKLSRISDVRVLKEDWKYAAEHVAAKTDVFGWTDMGSHYHICLDMGLRAMTYLCDTYTNASRNMFELVSNGIWRLDTIIYALDPARSFYLSMADEIEIQDTEDSEALRKIIRDFVLEHVWNKLCS